MQGLLADEAPRAIVTARSLIAVVALVVGAGCASAQRPTLANHFVRQGTPSVDLGGPRPAPAPRRRPASPPPAISSNVSRVSSGASLEATDPRLRTALTNLLIAPTVAHHLAVADAYRRLGIMDDAFDYLTKSLVANGPDSAVYDARARLWRDWGSPDQGLADAHRAVYYAPASAPAHNTLGTLLYRLGQPREAEAQFKEAVSLDPRAWYAYSNLCHVSLALGRTRDAIAQCRQASALRPKPATKAAKKAVQ